MTISIKSPTSTTGSIQKNGSDVITIDASDNVTVANDLTVSGQATIPTINLTGGQITFPGTQSASADANTLDDYEEGTWTPSIISTGATITLGNAQGYYTKIGNMVFAAAYTSIASITGTTTNSVVLAGLPFTAKTQGNDGASCVFGVQTFTTAGTAFVGPGSTTFNVYQQGGVTTMKANQCLTSFYLYTLIYQTA
jgi:hypothetical protein